MSEDVSVAEFHPGGFLECRTLFKEPIFSAWYGRGEILRDLYRALAPWRIELQNISWNRDAKNLQETQISCFIPSLSAAVHIGIGGVTMSALNPEWSHAEQLAVLFQTALAALKASTSTEIASHTTALGFHLKPGKKPFREVMKQFVNAKALGSGNASMCGISVYAPDYSFVVDSSALYPDSVFVKMTRVFPGGMTFDQMAGIIYRDEETLLGRLGLKLP